ncbi:serine/threonine-protein kinase [Actinomadura sp. DC4]|uniref:serine/threonine protein kinase n=1 Tax=Actinomadura sp. DC4 TaxID=3055069 RepID=UPI0025AF1204|nr:serine/threonine-protein kinase [Actinomadura sp. DC4]MDN3355016.1 serine/threonine-protein kinase [Actinomadura sp. DC4]
MPDAAPLEPGDPASLGQYEVVGKLGEGGQGAVYLGRSPSGQHVAIKLLHAQMNSDSSARTRFAREVEAAQKVSPFCTAQVLDYDLHGRPPYIISEFIDGPPLYDVVIQEGAFQGASLERLAIGTATALAAIHEAGIVHRDFKPNNVLLASDGPRVVDFGIARSVDSQQSSVTATGMVVGTPGYLAPEQLTGEPLTAAVDIFAWGATMVFAATGHSPFEAETLPVIINRILNEQPDLSRLTGTMRELVGMALDKDPRRRPAAHQLLLRLLGQVGATPSPSADRDDLLGKGTRIAAEMPPPPPIVNTPPPAPYVNTPTPMMHGQATPNPMMMPGPQTPPPWQQHQHTAPMPPRFTPPPPRRKSSNAPIFVGIGCVVFLLLVVGLPIALAAGFMQNAHHNLNNLPTYTPSHYGVPDDYVGTWKGSGHNTDAKADTRPFDITITLNNGSRVGHADYGNCTGSVFMEPDSSNDSRVVFSQTLFNQSGGTCPTSSYITMTLSGSSMTWAMSKTSYGSSYANGTLNKQ